MNSAARMIRRVSCQLAHSAVQEINRQASSLPYAEYGQADSLPHDCILPRFADCSNISFRASYLAGAGFGFSVGVGINLWWEGSFF
jgi:hypothetical protein